MPDRFDRKHMSAFLRQHYLDQVQGDRATLRFISAHMGTPCEQTLNKEIHFYYTFFVC